MPFKVGEPNPGFKPGQSGNPGGKNPEREELRRYVLSFGRESIDGIVKLAREASNEKVQLDAQKWIAEQCIGKALVAISGEDGKPIQVGGIDELMELIRTTRERG